MLDDVPAPIRAMVASVACERCGHAPAVERLAMDDATARAQVGHDMDMVVGEAEDDGATEHRGILLKGPVGADPPRTPGTVALSVSLNRAAKRL